MTKPGNCALDTALDQVCYCKLLTDLAKTMEIRRCRKSLSRRATCRRYSRLQKMLFGEAPK